MPQEQAVDLYDEVLERIQTNYVDPVPLEPLVRHGLDNLEVALRDPVFVKTNAPTATPERVDWLRDTLKRYRARLVIPDRSAAIRMALSSCEAARQAIGLASTPVLLEFTCGACDALDDFTSYLTPDKLEDLYAMIDGNFVGLGVELKIDKEGLRLVGVIRGGPAWEAGLKAGELIVGDRRPLDQGAEPGRGRQPASRDRRDLRRAPGTAARRHEPKPSAGSPPRRRRERRQASSSSTRPTASATSSSPASRKPRPRRSTTPSRTLASQGMRALVLDLRGNPGGLLNVAVEIAERFID